MSLLKTPWFTIVEVQIAGTAQQVQNFQDQPNLTTTTDQQIRILGVELMTPDVLPIAPSGNTNAPIAELQKSMLTLVDDDMQKVYQYPVLGLNRVMSPIAGGTFPSVFDLQLFEGLYKIAWTKCKIEFATPPAGAPYSICFGVHYAKLLGENVKQV